MSFASERIVVTGGAGFIGSHIVELFAEKRPQAEIIVLDNLTYAGREEHLHDLMKAGRVVLARGDIADHEFARDWIRDADILVHAAAESHVDRSYTDPQLFVRTNVLGTHSIMEAARKAAVPRIVHVSTDEVYGEVLEGASDEETYFNPTNPYSATKAAAEMVVRGYVHSFKLPVIVLRGNNAFGIRQHPEKLIPRVITSLIDGTKIPVHGRGCPVRHYLSAWDFARAVFLLADKGSVGEAYNVGSREALNNMQVISMICKHFGVEPLDHVEFTSDRPFNDRRYSVDWMKIAALGWSPRRNLAGSLGEIVDWYRDNRHLVREKAEPRIVLNGMDFSAMATKVVVPFARRETP